VVGELISLLLNECGYCDDGRKKRHKTCGRNVIYIKTSHTGGCEHNRGLEWST